MNKDLEGNGGQAKEREEQKLKEFSLDDFKAMLAGGKLYDGRNISSVRFIDPKDLQKTKKFIQDPNFASQRRTLALRLKLLKQLLSKASSHEDAKGKAEQLAKKASELLKKNLGEVSEKTRDLERRYRTFALLIANAQTDPNEKLKVTVLNADQAELFEPDSDGMKKLGKEIQNYGEYADYKDDAYGLLVIPGDHYRKEHLGLLGTLCKNSRCFLITDALATEKGLREPEDYLDQLEMDQHKSIPNKSHESRHFIVTVNEAIGREKEPEYEDEDVYLPASAALAGMIIRTDNEEGPHVTPAGEIKGDVRGAARPKIVLNAREHGLMREMGLVPLASPKGTLRFMGARSLCTAEEFKFFAISRVYDMICNVLQNFAKSIQFRNFDGPLRHRIEQSIMDFLRTLRGPGRPLREFSRLEVYEDTSTGEAGIVRVKVELTFNMPIDKVLFDLPVKFREEG
ncbi:hypothetical protein ACFL6M_05070 [Candidatus Eisenbacteria bacterium]|uniref:Type VI secretion system contractile sheath protein TssC n=1 Tax=Eiseniibacteriota bacterium TaxID=2212470 RepID=A0ABV6YKW4_UNCEI